MVIHDPIPSGLGADGISLSQAVKCKDCTLEVDTNISSSTVKLTRELGDISKTECASYIRDGLKVSQGILGLQEFLAKLRAGEYARETTTQDGQVYCQMLGISEENAAKVKTPQDITDDKLERGRVRKLASAGSYSSGTKARFIPSIPFKMKFKATQIVESSGPTQSVPLETEVNITQMTLYYPSPVRIDSIQADAVLSLNDPSDSSAKAIVLIPLRGSSGGGEATQFINKIAGNLVTVSEYDRATGTYPSADIQTGSDWSLGKLFTVGTEGKDNMVVKNGFFTWTGLGELEPYIKSSTPFEIRHSWRRKAGSSAPQYFMLDTPLSFDSTDLATITRSLPPTDPSQAISPIPNVSSMVFHKDAEAPAPDTISGRTGSCGIGNLCEGYANIGIAKEPFEGCPGGKCDPFLQNAKKIASDGSQFFSPQNMFGLFFNFLVAVAMFVGAYIAMQLISEDYELPVRDFSIGAGTVAAVWAKGLSKVSVPSIGKLKSMGMSMAQSQISSRSPASGPSL